MIVSSYRCIEQISEARRLYDQGQVEECQAIVQDVQNCSRNCGEISACTAALRIISRGMTLGVVGS